MIRSPAYRAHEGFIAPARPFNHIWRLLVGMLIAGIVYVTMNQVYFSTLYSLFGRRAEGLYQQMLAGSTPLAEILFLLSFGCITLSTGLAVRMMHRRGVRTVFGPWPLLAAQFGRVFAMLILLNLVITVLPPWGMMGELSANLSLGRWLAVLPFSLIAVLVQVSAEEVFFRGYLQQQLAARFRTPLIWMLVPSALFALGHYQPDVAGENAVMMAVGAVYFELLMADLTARAGTLGPAIAASHL